ncbi:MAG: cellulase family glycosylhydrolase [Spirochaetes bacterium]|nr:cellulase family glycosylhydrolase [Spirochaetota bacterium]
MIKKKNWQEVHGANYIASYARNSVEMWERFDSGVIDRELGYARSMGLNSVRVWLDSRPYRDNPGLMLNRIGKFLSLCEKHRLSVIPILFDSCGIEEKDLKDRGEDAHWGRWITNPGYDYLLPRHWDRLEKYVEDIIGVFLDDPCVLAWDVMNEPWCGKKPEKEEQKVVVHRFLEHFSELARSLNPDAPVTIGVTVLDRAEYVEDLVDLICFHSYETDPEKWKLLLKKANRYAELKGKPVLLTEWGYPAWGTVVSEGRLITDEDQSEFYEKIMPLLKESKIGWYLFDLIMGCSPFAHISVLKTDGDRRPSALVVEKYLEKKPVR